MVLLVQSRLSEFDFFSGFGRARRHSGSDGRESVNTEAIDHDTHEHDTSRRRADDTARVPLWRFAAMTLAQAAATVALTTPSADAEEIDLEAADSEEIDSYLGDLERERAAAAEDLELLERTREAQQSLITEAEREFGTAGAQLARATEALRKADGGLPAKIESLIELGTEHLERYETAERAAVRVDAMAAEIAGRTGDAEEIDDLIAEAERALREAEAAEAAARVAVAPPTPDTARVPESANTVVGFAYAQLGKPYGSNRSGPDAYDCSGLVKAAYAQAGVALSHSSGGQWNETTPIDRGELAPGDLVFYSGPGHTAIYIGQNQVIHAPVPGRTVEIAPIDLMPVAGYRRASG